MRLALAWSFAWLLPYSMALGGCTGVIGDANGENGGFAGGQDGRLEPDARGADSPGGAFVPAPGAMRRLTRAQYDNALGDIFGAGISPTSPLEADEETARFSSIGASTVATSSRGVEQYQEAALDVASQVLARRGEFPVLKGCAPASADDPCIADVVTHYGRLLFRRPLETAEVVRFTAIAGAAGDDADLLDLGMRYMLSALLQAPSFLYVPAVGGAMEGTDFRCFDGEEMASRLSLFLWNTVPDDGLLTAAAAGDLDSQEGVATEARRMLDDPRAEDLATRFIAESWHIDHLDPSTKHSERYPQWNAALIDDLRQEVALVLTDLQARNGDFLEVFDGTSSFVNGRLADFYGLDIAPEGFERANLGDSRTGLLTAAAVIAANSPSDRSTPTERGVFILSSLLCRSIPAPPAGALEAGLEALAMIAPGDERGFILARLEDPACGGCHAQVDPLGMALDDYDAIGVFRTGGDSLGELPGEPYVDVHDLAASLRGEGEASLCLTKRLLGFGGAHEIGNGEEVVITEVNADFEAADHSFEALVIALVSSDGFRFLSPPSSP